MSARPSRLIALACVPSLLLAWATRAAAQTAPAAPPVPPAEVASSAPATVAPSSAMPPSASAPPATHPPPDPTVVAPASLTPSPVVVETGPGKRYTTWDLNIDGAYGRLFSDPARWMTFGRVRAGVLWVRDPTFFSLGLTYDLSNVSNATLGIQGEWMNLEIGVWAQAGPLIDVANGGRLGAMGALGWSVLGVEAQVRDVAGSGVVPAVFAKLRIPIGIIAFGLRGR